MDRNDWKAELLPGTRQRIVDDMMNILQIHHLVRDDEESHELRKFAQSFEESTYTSATNKNDYLREISLKLLAMEIESPYTPPNSAGNSSNPPNPDTSDWKAQLQHGTRQRIAKRLMQTIRLSVQGTFQELLEIAEKFEEEVYTEATSQEDYLKKISEKMLSLMEPAFSNTSANSMSSNPIDNSNEPADPGLGIKSQVEDEGMSQGDGDLNAAPETSLKRKRDDEG